MAPGRDCLEKQCYTNSRLMWIASPERGGAAKGGGGVQPDDRPHASRSFGRIAAAGRSAVPKQGNGLPCGGVGGECQTGASYEKHSPAPLAGGPFFPFRRKLVLSLSCPTISHHLRGAKTMTLYGRSLVDGNKRGCRDGSPSGNPSSC